MRVVRQSEQSFVSGKGGSSGSVLSVLDMPSEVRALTAQMVSMTEVTEMILTFLHSRNFHFSRRSLNFFDNHPYSFLLMFTTIMTIFH